MGEAKRRAASGGANVPPHPNPSDERRIVWALSKPAPGDKPVLVLGLSDPCIAMLREGGITDIEFDRRQHISVPLDLRVMVFSAPTRARIMEMLGQGHRMKAEPPPEDVSAGDFRWTIHPVAVQRAVDAARRHLEGEMGLVGFHDDQIRALVMAIARGDP